MSRAAMRQAVPIRFVSDARGRIVWAGEDCAPMLVGVRLGEHGEAAPARSDERTHAALASHGAIVGGRVEIDGAPRIAGAWRIDAEARFDPASGVFLGHAGILRRADVPAETPDRLRQALHELRTPIHAIQGFAELIDRQLFGPVPLHYRELAGKILADAARIRAHLDKIEDMSRSEHDPRH